jgi:hypothetical protein
LNNYALYKFRSADKRYPKDFLQIHTEINTSWLIIGRELSYSEIVEFDLEYIGERMSYEMVQSEIKRLSMQGNH